MELISHPLIAGVGAISIENALNSGSAQGIIPCALYYSKVHQFRSDVELRFGPPLLVPRHVVTRYYRGDKQAALDEWVGTIRRTVHGLMVSLYAIGTKIL